MSRVFGTGWPGWGWYGGGMDSRAMAADSAVMQTAATDRVHGHRRLVKLLKLAHSAERAAAFAYVGHAASVKDADERIDIAQIEQDEWGHRQSVLEIMAVYDIKVSRWYEVRFWLTGKMISASCHVIGWFMPYYFAGRLESGNVCEYFVMMQYFHELGITAHDEVLYEMGLKEKEHEMFFVDGLDSHRLLPAFQKAFGWGTGVSYNDVDMARIDATESSGVYCRPETITDHAPRRSWRARRTGR